MNYLTMHRLFDDIFAPTNESSWTPIAHVEDAENHYRITLEIPGTPKENIVLETVADTLTLSAKRGEASFRQSYRLPPGIDHEKIAADYQDGVLRVTIPKAESAKPRRIEITSKVA